MVRDNERVLVLTPTGRDAALTCEVLRRDEITCEPCDDLNALVRELRAGAGALLIADEVLSLENVATLEAALERQESWSDLPIIVATTPAGAPAAHQQFLQRLHAANMTLLARPIPTVIMITAVRSALRARRRQYQRCDLLADLRQTNERLEAERRLRETFVAILAHDLRGPLATIQYATEILNRHAVSPEQRQELHLRVLQNVNRMERMTRDLLDVHRIQAGRRLPVRLGRCDLTAIARAVADELNVAYGQRTVLRGAEFLEGNWSAEELHRALWNLGTNALKYGGSGTEVEISVGRTDAAAWVSVRNWGTIIPQEEQARLFNPFSRARTSEASAQHGWGLGLALVRGCAEAHGGSVEVESTEQGGTTFTIRLPWDSLPFQAENMEQSETAPGGDGHTDNPGPAPS